ADHRLYDADEQQMAAGDRIDRAEHVRIERRLVEDVGADPVASGEASRPLVVAARIAEKDREERRRAHLPHMHEPYGKRRQEDPQRRRESLAGQRWYASARVHV